MKIRPKAHKFFVFSLMKKNIYIMTISDVQLWIGLLLFHNIHLYFSWNHYPTSSSDVLDKK